MIHILLDGDWILYTAGFACQHTEYVCYKDASDCYGPFENKTAMYEALGKDHDYPVYARTFTDPLDHTLHTVKQMVASVEQAVTEKFNEDVTVTVFLDGHGNFREDEATIVPYKGNRKDASKPLLYEEIREYIKSNLPYVIAEGHESDDEISIAMHEARRQKQKAIAVGVDKDLLQIPGWHFNPNKGFKKVSRQDGLVFLYRQALTGDAVDNIKGAYKIGPKAAEKIITADMTEEDMQHALVEAYEETIDKFGDHIYGGLDGRAAAAENYALVHLLEKRV